MDYYVIYDHPSDYPDRIVVRRYQLKRRERNPQSVGVEFFDTIPLAQAALKKKGLYQYPRNRDDDPVIVETWL